MAKIVYFGTNGSSGHTAIGIDANLKTMNTTSGVSVTMTVG